MSPEIRIRTILLLEKIQQNRIFAKEISVEDSSHYKQKRENGK